MRVVNRSVFSSVEMAKGAFQVVARFCLCVMLIAGLGSGLTAQAQQTPATTTPSAKPSPAKSSPPITDTNAYPYQKALDLLNGKQSTAPTVPSVSTAQPAAPSSTTAVTLQRTEAPNSPYRPTGASSAVRLPAPTPVAELSPMEMKALAIADSAKAGDAMPTAGKDGRVTYIFGAGLPTIITSPLHVSIIELEPGEVISGEPAIGDSIRWELMPGSSGSGPEIEPLVIIKPHEAGLDTNLVIATNKRTYYLRLVSRDHDYIARTAFSYKDDEDARWKQFLQQQQKEKEAKEDAQVVTPMVGDAIDHLNFDYSIKGDKKGGDSTLIPVRVMDDGVKTYITMPDSTAHLDLPALVVVNPRLKGEKAEEIVNYRVKGNLYIVDRLFDRAALVLGNGKAAQKVEIRRVLPLNGGTK